MTRLSTIGPCWALYDVMSSDADHMTAPHAAPFSVVLCQGTGLRRTRSTSRSIRHGMALAKGSLVHSSAQSCPSSSFIHYNGSTTAHEIKLQFQLQNYIILSMIIIFAVLVSVTCSDLLLCMHSFPKLLKTWFDVSHH